MDMLSVRNRNRMTKNRKCDFKTEFDFRVVFTVFFQSPSVTAISKSHDKLYRD